MRFLPVYAAIAFDLAAFGMAFTDIALRARSYGAAPWLVGLLLSSYFVCQIATSAPWGALSDRIGRKPVAVACTALSAFSMVVYALWPNLIGILASRVLAGLAAANVPAIQAALADETPSSRAGVSRATVMGRFSAALNMGLIVGFAGGGFIAEAGPRTMGFVGAALSGVATLLLVFGLPATTTREHGKDAKKRMGFRLLRAHPILGQLFLIAAVSWFSLACLEGTFSQLLNDRFNEGQRTFGLVLMAEMGLGFLIQSFLFKRLSENMPHQRVLLIGYILQGVGLALTPLMPFLSLVIVASGLYAIGKAISDPSMNTMTSEATPEDRQGEMFGMLQAARNVGFLVGPSLGGLLYGFAPAIPYLVAGAVSIAAALMAAALKSPSEPLHSHSP